MSNEPRIFPFRWLRLVPRFWGRAPQCHQNSIDVDPLPSGPRRRLARLLAISGCITIGGCLGTGAEVAATCPPGHEDLWNDGTVCVAVDEYSDGIKRRASDERCDDARGGFVCAAASLCPGGCGPTAVCVAGDGIRGCARPIGVNEVGRGAVGPPPAWLPPDNALTQISLR